MALTSDQFRSRRVPWFWWLLANLLALCFAILSWILAMEIFGRPDVPHNYRILRSLNRAPEFKAFRPTGAPDGRLFDPPGLYGWFFSMGEKRHAQLNSLYVRNFMRNFDDPLAVTYVEGDFEVLTTRRFGPGDFLPEGFAVRARALVKPDDFSPEAPYPVVLELMLPTADRQAMEAFTPGVRITLDRAPNLPVVMHVGRHLENDEPVVRVTALPIGYDSYLGAPGRAVDLEVPEWVEPEGKFPLFEPGAIQPSDG